MVKLFFKCFSEIFRKNIESFAAKNKITLPENYSSYSDLIAQLVDRYEADIDKSANEIIETYLPFLKDLAAGENSELFSYEALEYPSPMLAVQFSFLGLEVNFYEGMSPIEMGVQILNILKSPVMYLLLTVFFLLFFLLISLFSMSFRKAFLFTGIATALTGVLLIVCSQLSIPFASITEMISTGNAAYDCAITEALSGAWPSISSNMIIHASVSIVIAVVFFLIFSELTITRKKSAAETATVEAGDTPKTNYRYTKDLLKTQSENTEEAEAQEIQTEETNTEEPALPTEN